MRPRPPEHLTLPALPPLAVLLLTAFALPAAAQIDYPKPQDPERGSEQLDREGSGKKGVDQAESASASTQAKAQEDFWAGRSGRVVEVFRAWEAEPVHDGQNLHEYLNRLRSFGLDEPRKISLEALTSFQVHSVQLGAAALEFVGEPEDVDALVDTAAAVASVPVAGQCLETALRLNGGKLPGRAVRLLDHPKHGVRAAAEARLARHPQEDYLPRYLQLLAYGRDPDVRLRAARLLASFAKRPEIRQALRAALHDASGEVAFRALMDLVGEAGPEEIRAIHDEILTTDPGLELAYLYQALLIQQKRVGTFLVEDDLLPKLFVCLDQPDLFLSGAAAACLAEYDFRKGLPEGYGEQEGNILHVLVRAVGGLVFYPQYSHFSSLAEESLRRFTGEDFHDQDRSAWLAWMAENFAGFHAVRGNLHLTDRELPQLRIAWEESGRGRFVLAGTAAPVGGASGRLLGPREQAGLRDFLARAQLLDVRVLPGVYGSADAPLRARIDIEVGRQRKPLTFRGTAGAEWLPGLLQELDRVWEANAWQGLAPLGDDGWVRERLTDWDSADPLRRRQLELAMTRERLEDLNGSQLLAWCRHLSSDPAFDSLWTAELGHLFLERLTDHGDREALAKEVLACGLRKPDASLAQPFLDIASRLIEPLRSELLRTGLERLGAEVAAASLSDSRLAVRVAAARALGGVGAAGMKALVEALKDRNTLVVRMAARSLGEIGDATVLPQLLPLVGPEHPKEVRREVLVALGRIGDPRALDAVVAAAESGQDDVVRQTAIQALSRLPGEKTDQAFQSLFPVFANGPLEVGFLRGLDQRGILKARAAMRAKYEDFDSTLALRASIHGGQLGDGEAAEKLLHALSSDPHNPEILSALASACCVDFRSLPDPVGVYTAWWRENGDLQFSFWLERAANNVGRKLPEEFDRPDKTPRPQAVRALLDLLADCPGFLRPPTALALADLTGVDLPAFAVDAPKAVVLQQSRPWEEWLAAQGK